MFKLGIVILTMVAVEKTIGFSVLLDSFLRLPVILQQAISVFFFGTLAFIATFGILYETSGEAAKDRARDDAEELLNQP